MSAYVHVYIILTLLSLASLFFPVVVAAAVDNYCGQVAVVVVVVV